LTFSILSAAPTITHAQAVAKEFLDDWYGMNFKVSLELEETWDLPESYDVLITITITDMGGNEYLLLERIEAGVGIYAKEELQVNGMKSTGEVGAYGEGILPKATKKSYLA